MVADEEIAEVAGNARIDLSGEEIAGLKQEFEEILDSFAALDDVDTEGVEPSLHPIEHEERVREDEQEECLSQDEALANSENTEKGYFKGPRAVE